MPNKSKTNRVTGAKTIKQYSRPARLKKRVTRATPVKKYTRSTRLSKLGFSASELKGLSPRVRSLTQGDLLKLAQRPSTAPAALKLTFRDLQGLQAVAARAAKDATTGGGGSGGGGVRCCCCVACCCCCCAVSVTQPSAVAVVHA